MALMNRHLQPRIETIFVMPNELFSYTSSSLVKQVAKFGGDVTHFVPPNVAAELEARDAAARQQAHLRFPAVFPQEWRHLSSGAASWPISAGRSSQRRLSAPLGRAGPRSASLPKPAWPNRAAPPASSRSSSSSSPPAAAGCTGKATGTRGRNSFPAGQPANVTRGEIVQSVTAAGTIKPLLDVLVSSQISGYITAWYADFNAKVKKGDLLATLLPTAYEAAVESAKGDLENSQANAQLQAVTLERDQVLLAKNLIAQSDYDSQAALLAEANAEVEIKQAALRTAQDQSLLLPDRLADGRDDHLAQHRRRQLRRRHPQFADALRDRQRPDARCRSTPPSPRPTSATSRWARKSTSRSTPIRTGPSAARSTRCAIRRRPSRTS